MKSLLVGLLVISSSQTANATISATTLAEVREKVVELHITHKPDEALSAKLKIKTPKVIELGHSICSGAFIDNRGVIVTARHCAADVQSIDVITFDQHEYKAEVMALSPTHDLALIHIDRYGNSYFKLAMDVTQGQTIYTFGSPLAITGTLAQGIVARLNGDVNYVDCSVLPGNSGGPLFDDDGNLVGITTAGFVVLYGMTHLNIAQSPEAIWFFVTEVFSAFNRHGK